MQYIRAGGKWLEYVRITPGSNKKPVLVFLHEGLGSVSLWKDFPARVAQATGCAALVYSRAGYGHSEVANVPRRPRFMHEEAVHSLPGLLRAFRIQRPLLIGHSDGASIALIYAGSEPEVEPLGLILEAPHVFVEDITVRNIAEAKQKYLQGSLKERLKRHHARNVDHSFLEWARIWLNPEFRSAWGTGDSDMFRYEPHCNVATVCNTRRHLERRG